MKWTLQALPGGAQPFLSDGGLDARMGVRNNQSRPFHSPFLEILENERQLSSDSSNIGSTARISRFRPDLPQAINTATETTRPSILTF